jgi:undecaprenyl-diphosphatase
LPPHGFIANDVISIVPLLAVALWLWGPRKQLSAQRQLVIKVTMAMAISMSLSLVLGHLFPHNRPFVDHVGYNFLPHSPDYSFPSDHGTVILPLPLPSLPGIGPGPARY